MCCYCDHIPARHNPFLGGSWGSLRVVHEAWMPLCFVLRHRGFPRELRTLIYRRLMDGACDPAWLPLARAALKAAWKAHKLA
jgi:hypothetical protein